MRDQILTYANAKYCILNLIVGRKILLHITIQIYKMYNTTLLKILPASGKLGFISPARSLI
jgi:hypothetical protein